VALSSLPLPDVAHVYNNVFVVVFTEQFLEEVEATYAGG
jgi:hypothetical protein